MAETPAEFLRRTAGGGGGAATSTAPDTPAAFLARTAPKAAETTTAPARWEEPNPAFAMGDPREALPPAPAVGRIEKAMGEAYREAKPILTPQERYAVGNSGFLGQQVYNPLLDFLGGVRGVAHGIGAGIGATAYEVGNALAGPRLGRDLSMGTQVAGALVPQATGAIAGPRAWARPDANPLSRPQFVDERMPLSPEFMANPMAPEARSAVVREITDPSGAPTSPTGIPLSPETRAGPRVGKVPAAEEPHGAANTAGDIHGGEAPVPRSGGAAATPGEAIPDQTRIERARNLRVSINETAKDRAGTGLVDDTPYVTDLPRGAKLPPRLRPERDFSPQTALDHKERLAHDTDYRTQYEATQTERNTGMRDLLMEDAGDGNTLEQLRKTRREVAPDAFGAFDGEQAVDASGLRTRIQRLRDSPEGKRGAVERTLDNVLGKLHDREGNLETMPSTLYGVRKHIDDLIEKARNPKDREGTDAAVAVHILRDLAPEVDSLIQSGAGRYQLYRDAYREASQPVNQQRFLQQYQGGTKKLWDKDGNLQLTALNRMLEDIHAGLSDTKFNLAHSLTEEQIQNIINVRNELAAKSLRDTQAGFPGSPTTQLLNQAAKRGSGPLAQTVKGLAELGVHGLSYSTTGEPLLNAPIAAWTVTRHLREARRMEKRKAEVEEKTNALTRRLLSNEPVNPLTEY